ncbi:MlaA family lipoprotein [Alteromonas oceanisediminis]|uniref:MlaA family lipoprotein n=1 Tax=Alteromonas oceanisediminis TaxID=2836180 RepID=UPI001BDAE9A5|nr:VacJ family lipoprotein [Alteromonas oceanisediminis]MBT0585068.1 VacJ family lipoprotein [Alteromonas oceanisediminis]
MKYPQRIATLIAVFLLTACAANNANQQATADEGDPRDPFEPVNRVVWDFNYDVLDEYIVRPVTVGYVTVMPQFARTALLNAAQNLEEPLNVINNLLQGKASESADSFARFVINSTIGLVGTIDVAEKMGVPRQEEDFDEVLGVWGVGNGPYLMVPAAGPYDARGVSGQVVDIAYFPSIVDFQFTLARLFVETIEARARLMEQEQQLENSPDPYAFVKNAYFQNKEFQVTDGKSGEKEIDDQQLEDFEAFEDMLEDL